MNSVTITGPRESMQGLLAVQGLTLLFHGAQQIDDNLFSVGAFATDAAIAKLQARVGVTITVLQDNTALDAHFAQVKADIAAADGGGVV